MEAKREQMSKRTSGNPSVSFSPLLYSFFHRQLPSFAFSELPDAAKNTMPKSTNDKPTLALLLVSSHRFDVVVVIFRVVDGVISAVAMHRVTQAHVDS